MAEYEYLKYVATKETLRETIDTFGVAIIPNVLNDGECDDIVSGIWDFFEHITQAWEVPIKRGALLGALPPHPRVIRIHSQLDAELCPRPQAELLCLTPVMPKVSGAAMLQK